MLHITSFVQNIAKINKKNIENAVRSDTITSTGTSLNSRLTNLNRNYSFVYDHNLKRYDYQYNNDYDDNDTDVTEQEQQGFWGYLRDKNADLNLNKQIKKGSNNKNTDKKRSNELHDGYWGNFKDNHLITNITTNNNNYINNDIDTLDKSSLSSSLSATFSLSSSINSLSRFRDISIGGGDENDYDIKSSLSSSFREFDYKTPKFKIQARKRDEMKILIQSLEDKEAQFNKETIKSFDSPKPTTILISNEKSSSLSSLNLIYSSKIKEINFLHFSTYQYSNSTSSSSSSYSASSIPNRINLNKFKNIFNTVSKLNKSINMFNGDILTNVNQKSDITLLNNVHANMFDLSGFVRNYFHNSTSCSSDLKTTAISLCSNIFESNNNLNESTLSNHKLFGNGTQRTMMFEYQNIKIGFMALIDNFVYDKLHKAIKTELSQKDSLIFENDEFIEENDYSTMNTKNQIEYVDFILEADRLSKQLRECGANVIVCLINMESEQNEQRLIKEANDLDIIFSGYNNNVSMKAANSVDLKKISFNNRFLIKTESNFDCLSLVTLRLDEFDSNKIVDIAISKYIVD